MPLFRCSKCGCVENTAVSNYWLYRYAEGGEKDPLCSGCDPEINKWHGLFEQKSAKGYKIGADGFLYHREQIHYVRHTELIGDVK